jgi:phenylpropionate dioxygenase-like ring-hydroxylating dioxygenase large terminal subunit
MDEWDEALGAVTVNDAGPTDAGLPVGLPMPRDRELLFDRRKRVRVTRAGGRRYPFPVPNGWFVVAESGDLRPGDVRALYYFARDLVLYRTEGGEARLVDAHCPHLGAHLGVGGKVEGDRLRCPFHGWAFDGASGACVEIPYGEGTRIPARAAARAYPTLERNGMVWAWYHAEGADPFYEVPVVGEFDDPDWSAPVVRAFEVAVPAQDMAENNVDFAHFRYVHGTDAIPEDEFHVEGTYKRAVGMDGNFVREGYGLGLGVLRIAGYVTFLSSTTPIDEESVHVRWVFTAPVANGEDAVTKAADSFCDGVSQDIPIWENKVYRERPVLTRSERPIIEHRRWAQQFYSHYDGEPLEAPEA